MTPADAFESALQAEYGRGSDLRMALEAVGGSTRTLADELGVSQRTVQRWQKFESGAAGERRNPATSGKSDDLRAMADVQRQERALDRLANMSEFDSDSADLNYETDDGEDEGSRQARTAVAPLNMRPTVDLYRRGAAPAEVGASFASALGASYGVPETLVITNIEGLTLR
jgi:hypothetical protein